MTLHLWSHWFWITSLFFAFLTVNVIADNDSSQEEIPHHLAHFHGLSSELGSKDPEISSNQNHGTTLPPSNRSRVTDSTVSPEVLVNESKADVRAPKSISNHNTRFSITESPELAAHMRPEFLPTPVKPWGEPSSMEVVTTDSNGSYLIDETSNSSTSTHLVPDRNTVAYSVDLANTTDSHTLFSTSPAPSTTTGVFVTISKSSIDKVHKNKIPEDKVFKKNATNLINGITLKKILASNKTKQQAQLASPVAVNVVNTNLSTSEFKEVDHTAYQNDSPSAENKTVLVNKTAESQSPVIQVSNIVPIVPVKNETDEDSLFSGNETSTSFNRSAENASFSTLNERIVAPDETALSSFNIIVIVVISATVVTLTGLIGAVSFVMYRRYRWNKPQTLSDKCSNADSSGYIDDSTLRENSEEMYSLDNDSFLNSLEAMTIQNYWTDVKHTKL